MSKRYVTRIGVITFLILLSGCSMSKEAPTAETLSMFFADFVRQLLVAFLL